MLNKRLLNCWVLFLGMALVASSLAHAESFCTTQWGKLTIGTVEGNPFTADVWVTSWQVLPDGNKRQLGPLYVFHVARDGSGRVAIKGPLIYGEPGEPYVPGGSKSLERLGEPEYWQMIICDPFADTTTTYQHSSHLLTKQARVMTGRGSIPGLNHVHMYNRGRTARDGKWIDLGHKELEGIQAHGYRWWMEKNSYGAVMEEDFTEQWISEDLASELSVVEMDQTHSHEDRTELIHIHRIEIDPSLFQIPRDYEVLKVNPKPIASTP